MSLESVTVPYAEHARRTPDWRLCRDCDRGGRAIRAAAMADQPFGQSFRSTGLARTVGRAYLPRPLGMANDDRGNAAFAFYVANAPFFNGFGRALTALHGMVFRKQPEIVLPSALQAWEARATRAGRSLEQVIRAGFREQVHLGRVALLADAPLRQPGRVYSIADVERLGLTPYIETYRAEDIHELLYGMVNGRRTLIRARLHEHFNRSDPEDEFRTIDGERWRVLDLIPRDGGPPDPDDRYNFREHVYRQRVYERVHGQQGTGEIALVDSLVPPLNQGRPLDYIPLEVVDADGEPDDGDIAAPPLLDLAEHNISLFRVMAELKQGQWFTAFPQACFNFGPEDEELVVGSPVAWGFSHEHAKAWYMSHDGRGLASLEKEREELRREMAMLGLRMLEPDRRQVEAAQTAAIHRQGEMSILQSLAQLFSEAMTRTVQRIATWQGIDASDISVELNQDFVPTGMDHLMVRALLEAVAAGRISGETFFEALKEGEAIKTGRTYEEELIQIQSEQPVPLGPMDDDSFEGEAEEAA